MANANANANIQIMKKVARCIRYDLHIGRTSSTKILKCVGKLCEAQHVIQLLILLWILITILAETRSQLGPNWNMLIRAENNQLDVLTFLEFSYTNTAIGTMNVTVHWYSHSTSYVFSALPVTTGHHMVVHGMDFAPQVDGWIVVISEGQVQKKLNWSRKEPMGTKKILIPWEPRRNWRPISAKKKQKHSWPAGTWKRAQI